MIWLQLLGVGKWLREASTGLIGIIGRYPLQAALIVSLCLAGWQWRGKRSALDELAAFKAAQVTATEAQEAVNHAPAVISQAIAEKSDAEAADYYAKGRAAGLAYFNAHRVRAEACGTVNPDLRGADHPAPLDDGSSIAPDMVAVSRADFDTLTGNSLRLAKVHQDALDLIASGIAVASLPEPDLSPAP